MEGLKSKIQILKVADPLKLKKNNNQEISLNQRNFSLTV